MFGSMPSCTRSSRQGSGPCVPRLSWSSWWAFGTRHTHAGRQAGDRTRRSGEEEMRSCTFVKIWRPSRGRWRKLWFYYCTLAFSSICRVWRCIVGRWYLLIHNAGCDIYPLWSLLPQNHPASSHASNFFQDHSSSSTRICGTQES